MEGSPLPITFDIVGNLLRKIVGVGQLIAAQPQQLQRLDTKLDLVPVEAPFSSAPRSVARGAVSVI